MSETETIHEVPPVSRTKVYIGSIRQYFGSMWNLRGADVKVIGLPGDDLDMAHGSNLDDERRGYSIEFLSTGERAYNVHRDSLR